MRYLPFLMLLSCAHMSPLEVRCRPLLSEIIAVQDVRNSLSDEMVERSEAYKRGDITADEHRTYFTNWMASENRLRQHVTSLYNLAYHAGCF